MRQIDYVCLAADAYVLLSPVRNAASNPTMLAARPANTAG